MKSRYVFDLAKVGPDSYSGWTPAGSYIVAPSGDRTRFLAVFTDRKGKQSVIGRFDAVRDAQIAAQVHAATSR